MLEREYQYFISHRDELLTKFNNRFVVIVEDTVIGDYATIGEALRETIKTRKLGTFLVQEISTREESYVSRFATPILAC